MKVRSTGRYRSRCPINIALETIGDAWSLLIVRDLMFKGRKRFNEFLTSPERIATNILTDRLARLERKGILIKRRDAEDARRFVYELTEKGIGLAPMLVEMVLWAAEHEQTDAPAELVKTMRADRRSFIAQVRADWRAARLARE
jgi:DNA-binding HxlR family transcriptional regulator